MAIAIGAMEIDDIAGIEAVYVGSTQVWPMFKPYLEIEPKIIWVNPYGSNDVLSNTDWNII